MAFNYNVQLHKCKGLFFQNSETNCTWQFKMTLTLTFNIWFFFHLTKHSLRCSLFWNYQYSKGVRIKNRNIREISIFFIKIPDRQITYKESLCYVEVVTIASLLIGLWLYHSFYIFHCSSIFVNLYSPKVFS